MVISRRAEVGRCSVTSDKDEVGFRVVGEAVYIFIGRPTSEDRPNVLKASFFIVIFIILQLGVTKGKD
jgi:hypothetical protein